MAGASIISSPAGTMPAAISCPTASAQRPTSSNAASSSSTRRGTRQQPHRHLDHDTEHAFGADDQREQVEARRPRPTRSRASSELAVHRDELHREHVVHRQPVLQAVHAAGILGDVAAHRAGDLRRWIGRVIEAERRGGLGHREVRDARLHSRDGAARSRLRESGRVATARAAIHPRRAARRRTVRCPSRVRPRESNVDRQVRSTAWTCSTVVRQRDEVRHAGGGRSARRTRRRRRRRARSSSDPARGSPRVRSALAGQCSRRQRLHAGIGAEQQQVGRPRRANKPQVTTPAIWLIARSSATGSTIVEAVHVEDVDCRCR